MSSKAFPVALLLLFVAVLPLFPFLSPGLPKTHDGLDHVARIANFYQSLQEGIIVPRWAGNLNWGYGHPIPMFLYPLPSYIASMFHAIGFSFIDSVKLVFGLGFLASGAAMWLWIRSFLGDKAGILAAFVYMFAPYRFVDLYVRGAIGEHIAFIFAPLTFYFLLKLSKNERPRLSLFLGSISLAFLILSHNAISLMFLPFIFFYMILLVLNAKQKQRLIISYVLLVVFGFGLSAFFWVPAYFEGKYTHRDILTAGVFREGYSDFSRFLFGPWSFGGKNELSVEVGKVQLLGIFLSLPALFLLWKKQKNRLLVALLTLIILMFISSLFLMTSTSDFVWEKMTILQKFQFPWRFLTLSVFSAAVAGGFVLAALVKKLQTAFLAISILALILLNKDYWQTNGYVQRPDAFFEKPYAGTTDTGESSPVWSVSYMKKGPDAHLSVIGGKATVKEKERTSTKHVYEVSTTTKAQLRENTIYFPGWSVKENQQALPVEYQAQNNLGVMTFFVEEGKHTITVSFTDTKLRQLANTISLLSLACITMLLFFPKAIGFRKQ